MLTQSGRRLYVGLAGGQVSFLAVTRRGEKMVFVRAVPNDEERKDGARPLHIGERVVMSGALELDSELTNLKSSPDEQAD